MEKKLLFTIMVSIFLSLSSISALTVNIPVPINSSTTNVNNSLCWQGLCNSPFSYFITTEVDPLWSANSSTVARIGNCRPGQVVMNTTTSGVQCVSLNPFNQSLNTNDNVTFNSINATTLNINETYGASIFTNYNGLGDLMIVSPGQIWIQQDYNVSDGRITIDPTGQSITLGLLEVSQIVPRAGSGNLSIGGLASNRIGFYDATPVAQASSTADLKQTLVNLGFIVGGGATPLNLSGGKIIANGSSLTDVCLTNGTNCQINTTQLNNGTWVKNNTSPTFVNVTATNFRGSGKYLHSVNETDPLWAAWLNANPAVFPFGGISTTADGVTFRDDTNYGFWNIFTDSGTPDRGFYIIDNDNGNIWQFAETGDTYFPGNIITPSNIQITPGSSYANHVVCYLSDGTLGHCTSIVGVTGTCTCIGN